MRGKSKAYLCPRWIIDVYLPGSLPVLIYKLCRIPAIFTFSFQQTTESLIPDPPTLLPHVPLDALFLPSSSPSTSSSIVVAIHPTSTASQESSSTSLVLVPLKKGVDGKSEYASTQPFLDPKDVATLNLSYEASKAMLCTTESLRKQKGENAKDGRQEADGDGGGDSAEVDLKGLEAEARVEEGS